MTPVSPKPEMEIGENDKRIEGPVDSIEHDEDLGEEAKDTADEASAGRSGRRMRGTRSNKHKTQSVSARRKYSRREGSAMVDEAAFKDFDYRMDASDYTPERCEELERAYWKTLTYAPPLYGADMMGTLFDDRTETWNLNKLPNLLDVLGTKIPGVNTAYLYLGMWKATFAWHLEDVDLYSINYLHFGAPKQWYSISQADARRFETAMKNVWPADAKACNQFLRHKGFLISPHHLLQQFGIKVNKVVSYPGEFVVTYPYGYHSGYNLGYNCAEAVNFALDTWLEMGKIAKRCECAQAQDSVWINVYEIERKLRGEETEYEETDDDDDEEEENDEELSGLPTPPASHGVKFKDRGKKRKRGPGDSTRVPKVKKIRLRLKSKAEPPCCLCPNDISYFDLLPTEDGRKAHKVCALYLPETYIDTIDGKEVVCNVGSIHKDRLSLKCLFCRSRRGACFQCSHKKCARGYHATCASAAGVFIEDQDVPVFDENGTEYKEQAFEFSCRFHRSRRDKKTDGDSLEANENIRVAAERLQPGQICQMQYLRGDIFAGIVIENRACEETLLLDILPHRQVAGPRKGWPLLAAQTNSLHSTRLEVEWKWMVVPDPSDYRLPKASAKALPMPASHRAKNELNAKRAHDDKPKKDDVFAEGYTWAEFETLEVANKDQAKVDFDKSDQLWHYLGKTSTEARARYTEDPRRQYHNPKSNYLDTIPKPPKPVPVSRPIFHHQSYIAKAMAYSYNLAANHVAATAGAKSVAFEKPYVYKPKKPVTPRPAMSVAPQPASQTNGTFVAYTSSQLAGYHQTGTPAPASHLPQSTPSQDRHQVTANVPQVNIPAAAPQAQQATNVNQIHHLPHPQSFLSTQAPSVQSGKPIWQIHSSIYERYPFFQVNHNRSVLNRGRQLGRSANTISSESFKYRTPYSPYGGFANGYGGDPGASMTACSNATTGLSSTSSAAPQTPVFSISQPASQAPRTKHAPAAAKSTRTGCHSAASALSMQSTKAASQVPMKVSPVPLPPHVVAALAKSTSLAPNQRFGSGPAMGSNEPPSAPARNVQSPSMMAWHTSVRPQPVAPESFGSPRQHVQKPAPVVPHGMRPQLPRPMAMQPPLNARVQPTQEFADVPGSGSMEFVERMMQNLRRASLNGENR